MQQLLLFDKFDINVPTEGIKYTGSKLKLIPYILRLIQELDVRTVLDGFSGTTRVSQALAKSGYQVICNDIAVWSEVFGTCYLMNQKKRENYQELIDHLNSIPPIDGWFTEFYGGHPNDGCAIQKDGLKKPWQIHNTRKLDGIRQEIETLNLNQQDKSVVLTSLILALDQVDNTLGHFASYLRNWSPRSYHHLVMRVPSLLITSQPHRVMRQNVFDLLSNISVDLAYFDPPYGSNNEKMPPSRVRYASYYHLWTSVCLFDQPQLFGKVNRRSDTSDRMAASIFEEFRQDDQGRYIAVNAIEKMLKEVKSRWVILSYSSGGRATAEELHRVIQQNGTLLQVLEIDYQSNVMAGMKWTNEWLRDVSQSNRELLFLIEK